MDAGESPPEVMKARTGQGRFRFAIKLRTMILLVLVAGVSLGWWQYRKRRAAVDGLIAQLSIRVLVSIGPTNPSHDPDFDPGGTYAIAIREVRRLKAEDMAVANLTAALRDGRLRRDEVRMRGALAALQHLGPALKSAGPEIVRVARGEGISGDNPAPMYLVQGFAVHVLAKIAKEDATYLPALIELIGRDDLSPNFHIRTSAASELAAFKAEGRPALPTLLRLIESPENLAREHHGIVLIRAISAIGPKANDALPTLRKIARDRDQDGSLRRAAIEAVASISAPPPSTAWWEQDLDPGFLAFITEFSDDPDTQVLEAIRFLERQIKARSEFKRRKKEQLEMIAFDRALGGRPRPTTNEDP